jgi:DNA invertase Pin-like site-specific DNA recombinase
MPRGIPYIRESTDDQVETGAGLEAQHHACTLFVLRRGLELGPTFQEVEGLSGATPFEKCPRLMDAVAELSPGDALVVSRRDRLARDRLKIIMFEQLLKTRACHLLSAAGEGTGAEDPNDLSAFLLRGIVDLFAEYERLVIKFRTASAMQVRRRAGDRVGRTPFGFDLFDDGRRSKNGTKDGVERPVKLVANPAEQAVLATMGSLRAAGESYRAIATQVNALGFRTKAEREWSHTSVRFVLTSPHPLSKPHDANQDEAAGKANHAAAGNPG